MKIFKKGQRVRVYGNLCHDGWFGYTPHELQSTWKVTGIKGVVTQETSKRCGSTYIRIDDHPTEEYQVHSRQLSRLGPKKAAK